VMAVPLPPGDSSFVPDWTKDAIFYQIFPDRFANGNPSNDPPGTQPWGGVPTTRNFFGGDLEGIISQLDYVKSLGVNALYLNPIFESTSNHKYHAKDYMKIDPHFGDEKVFKQLVDECHARGIRLVLDGVWNHTGVDFFAFEDIKKNGARSKYLGWFNIYSLPIGPTNKPNYECWWGYGDLPKLMTHHPAVREHIFQVTRHWMGFGIDGWRLDVPNEIPHQFWRDWRKLAKSINPGCYIVGEIWDDAIPWLKGDQFDGVMNYRFRKACLEFFIERTIPLSRFDSVLAQHRSKYPSEVNYVMQNLLGSHDTERILTMARGNVSSVKLAMLFQMTYVGAPMVYYGDEIGMEGGKDPGCRGTMIWDEERQNHELLEHVRSLNALRNRHVAFRRGSIRTVLADDPARVYAFTRSSDAESFLVVLNCGDQKTTARIPLNEADATRHWKEAWPVAGNKGVARSDELLIVQIPKSSGIVLMGGRE